MDENDGFYFLTEKTDITDEITIVATSDNVVLDSYTAYKCGNIVNLSMSFHPALRIDFDSNPNTFRFSINKYKPIVGMNNTLYTEVYAGIAAIETNGTISVRFVETQGYVNTYYTMTTRFSYIFA